jgi:hypothetical protein
VSRWLHSTGTSLNFPEFELSLMGHIRRFPLTRLPFCTGRRRITYGAIMAGPNLFKLISAVDTLIESFALGRRADLPQSVALLFHESLYRTLRSRCLSRSIVLPLETKGCSINVSSVRVGGVTGDSVLATQRNQGSRLKRRSLAGARFWFGSISNGCFGTKGEIVVRFELYCAATISGIVRGQERGIARVTRSVSSVESLWVRFIQSGFELQPPW